jgi:hypothetical protein
VALRAWALTLSFDPVLSQNLRDAMRLESTFGGYFLAPLVLATGVLLLEAGLTSRRAGVLVAALCLPAVALYLSWPRLDGSLPYTQFLVRFTETVGSPFWLAAMGAVAFFAYARLRGVRWAGPLCAGALGLTAFVDRGATGMPLTPDLSAAWLVLLALAAGATGWRRRDSRWAFVSAVSAIAAMRAEWLSRSDWLIEDVLPVHLLAGAALVLGALFRDRFARLLQHAGAAMLLACTLAATVWPAGRPGPVTEAALAAYLVSVVGVAFAYSYVVGNSVFFFAALAGSVAASGRALADLASYLQMAWRWQGAGYFVAGLAWFALAVLISLAKTGWLRGWARVVPRRAPGKPNGQTA